MGISHDPTHPTGVVSTAPRGNSELTRSRQRKANAALEMRRRGDDWEDVAVALGYPDASAAQVATEKALEDGLLAPESQEFLRTLASSRLEEMIGSLYKQATNPEAPDQLQHAEQVRKLIREQADIVGFKAPQEFTVNNPSAARLEAWVALVQSQDTTKIAEADIFGEPVEMVEDPETGVFEEVPDAVQPE